MKVLVIGGGGREHALAWKLAQSNKVGQVFVAPGNAGTAIEKKLTNIDIAATDIAGLLSFAQSNSVDLTVVGPEAPLVLGVVDEFTQAGLKCFGPTKDAAQLEGSKAFSKDFLARHKIPTAEYKVFSDLAPALEYIAEKPTPIVVKADGLAAGKGVILAANHAEAEAAVRDMLSDNKFGDAGSRVVIEEFLYGEEASFIVMVDGKNVLPMATSQDHKARDDGDKGPNTGGMGAYSPAPVVTDEIYQKAMDEVIMPTVVGMAQDGLPYTGFLYAGLMISPEGEIKVLEFNCRFGDPETQPILMRLKTDMVDLIDAGVKQQLDRVSADWDSRPGVGVVMAAGGYPDDYRSGDIISGLESLDTDELKVFHAGTSLNDAGQVVTSGGRVLCVTALGNSVTEAQKLAYKGVAKISWEGSFSRSDIGYKAIDRE